MFQYKTAWFSSSVPQEHLNFWILNGGTIACWSKADYLFSAEATCPDTVRIFESKDYLWNKVTVFHSLFLSACKKRQSVKSVSIGHYVLPPASVQEEVRNVAGRFIWEREDEQSVAQDSRRSCSSLTEDEDVSMRDYEPFDTDSSDGESQLCHRLQKCPDIIRLTGYVSINELSKYSGDLCDFNPQCLRCSNCKTCCCWAHA
ncbi:telomere repeats-binding bouquet formation protein 2 [Pholidichthys leucotaenia]